MRHHLTRLGLVVILAGVGFSSACGGSTSSGACGKAIPDAKPATCSTQGTTAASLTIQNNCSGLTLEVFWVNYQCGEISYGTIAPGQKFQSNSYVTHPWRLRDASTHILLREIAPLTGPTDIMYP